MQVEFDEDDHLSSVSHSTTHNDTVGDDDDKREEMELVASVAEPCWLCTYCLNDLALRITIFIDEKIADIDLPQLCEQVHEVINSSSPNAVGAGIDNIRRHITMHMITPNVKISSTIRAMSAISDAIRQNIFKRDEEAGIVVMDKTSAELYLKFTAQIAALYKLDPSKSLFGSGGPNRTIVDTCTEKE